VTFTALATGMPPLIYQWRKNSVALPGATSSTLTLLNATTNTAGNYDVMVTNSTSAAISSTSTLLIAPVFSVTTLAGNSNVSGSQDGGGSTAQFWAPAGIAVDSGNLFVADSYNSTIRKISPSGVVTTVAGLAGYAGAADGGTNQAEFYWPYGVSIDSSNNIFVADTYNCSIRKITSNTVSTVAGQSGSAGSTDGIGNNARFNYPYGIAADAGGALYIADTYNSTVRRIGADGVTRTIVGLSGSTGVSDGTNSNARFNLPRGIAVDSSTNIFLADTGNSTVRRIKPAGTNWVVTTIVGTPGLAGNADGVGTAARFDYPVALAVDFAGNVFVADQGNNSIRQITGGNSVTTLAGSTGAGFADGPGTSAQFWSPSGLAVDNMGNIYIADTDNNVIRIARFGLFLAPSLQMLSSGGALSIAWPRSALGYVPESASALSSNAIWVPLLGQVTTNTNGFSIATPVTGPRQFYRLHRP
jgi:hypothetical protein